MSDSLANLIKLRAQWEVEYNETCRLLPREYSMLWVFDVVVVEFPDLQESGPDIAAETDIIYRALIDDRLCWHVTNY